MKPGFLMIKTIFVLLGILIVTAGNGQHNLRSLEDLVNTKVPAWPFVKQMIDTATNKVEVLPIDSFRAKDALYKTQVTTQSPMGAVIYHTGGILVDNGWIRILGSGSKKLQRTLPAWNKGKSFADWGQKPAYVLIADDAAGGFFAINGGAFGKDKGNTYYLSPDRLVWEPLRLSYTDFLYFCFNNDLDGFYANLRWKGWQEDVSSLSTDKAFSFYPALWSKEGKDINKNKKKKIPVGELFLYNLEMRKKLGLEKPAQ